MLFFKHKVMTVYLYAFSVGYEAGSFILITTQLPNEILNQLVTTIFLLYVIEEDYETCIRQLDGFLTLKIPSKIQGTSVLK